MQGYQRRQSPRWAGVARPVPRCVAVCLFPEIPCALRLDGETGKSGCRHGCAETAASVWWVTGSPQIDRCAVLVYKPHPLCTWGAKMSQVYGLDQGGERRRVVSKCGLGHKVPHLLQSRLSSHYQFPSRSPVPSSCDRLGGGWGWAHCGWYRGTSCSQFSCEGWGWVASSDGLRGSHMSLAFRMPHVSD